MEVRNARTKIVLEPRTSAILRIEDCVTGQVHVDACRGGRHDQRLFRAIASADSWWSCFADSQDQTHVECTCDGARARIEYPDLVAADGTQTGVAVRVRIEPAETPDEVLLTMQVDNRGRRTVLDTTFPLLGGWHEQGGRGRDRIALGANGFTEPRMFPTGAGNHYARNRQRAGWFYPVHLACPWVDVGKQGHIFICHLDPPSRTPRPARASSPPASNDK